MTDALNAALQYRNHPPTQILSRNDDKISQIVLQHIRKCTVCSKLHNTLSEEKYDGKFTCKNITELNIGDIFTIPLENIFDADRTNDKNEFFNPPEVCVLDIQENEIKVAQCFPVELKPIANNGDFLTNDGYYVEAWNQYTLSKKNILLENYLYEEYIKKSVSKKLMKNIIKYGGKHQTNNDFVNKFRENELRIAQIWTNLIQSK